ncbi:hypothetical protein Q9247_00865 [Halomonas meridiana]|uniref:hypothetical protein n=1 Tax=Vreelandella aquamarina TaxID=77097 RepID=UPI00273CCCA2|nr:hypothetical protein [Halomonas meridiana]MDP4556229.1 hypothetical protein [Halomonas meridiana]
MKIQVYTLLSNDRLDDALVLFSSLKKNTNVDINVIPFDFLNEQSLNLVEAFDCRLVTPDPFWDEVGEKIFGNHLYRPGVLAKKYFRKLNALTDSRDAPFVFLDANTLIVDDLNSLFFQMNKDEIVFGSRAMKGRNFNCWGKSLLNKINPDMKDGFNAGFWGAVSPPFGNGSSYSILIDQGQKVRDMLTLSPEQSVLSFLVAINSVKPKLICDVLPGYSNLVSVENIDNSLLEVSNERNVRFADKRALALKWTGRGIVLPEDHPAEILKRYYKEKGQLVFNEKNFAK